MPDTKWRRRLGLRLTAALLVLGDCSGAPSALDAQGYAAERINLLWWVMLAIGTAVFVLMTGLLLLALLRRRGEDEAPQERERRQSGHMIGGGGVALPLLLLVPLVDFTAYTGASMTPPGERALTIEVIDHQFWWELRYPEQGFTTANELMIPAGRPVELRLSTADVLHSFWVPQLNGKMDLVPGQANTLTVQADEPGEYRSEQRTIGVQVNRLYWHFVVLA